MDQQFPGPFSERCFFLNELPPKKTGEFVLYWAHHALRAHQNPALETAAGIARQLGLPLLVYQGLGGRHRYNSDRHHHFILESARDFDAELQSLGLRLHFHLPADPAEKGPLPALFDRAAFVVTELFPVPPFTHWYRQHLARRPDVPFLLVDATCLLPMPLSPQPITRAFQFRNRYFDEICSRATRPWPELRNWPKSFSGDPGFEPFDLTGAIAPAVAGCRIDHSVPPLAKTPGGTSAGYRRWQAFLTDALDHYHERRDDAALTHAVSRMSAYLHYGCVSPFRIAREALERGGEGAGKFLDELLVWRELSHHFCFHSPDLESLAALPGWAAESLLAHQADTREYCLDWERLSRARTGETLWDLAQTSLLRRGELHNNVRMTWGKGFLHWTRGPARAQKLMIDLNHRFALDGNDPNSYGGLLWCLGQFDRAFPASSVFGKVRQRSIKKHAQRLDMARYAQTVSKPATERVLRVIVIGAGMAGLSAARTLQDQGHQVTVLEKARGAGGRMSTRRRGELRFDHGAQYFTADDPRFLRHVVAWQERGLVEEWQANIGVVDESSIRPLERATNRYVPVPSMNEVCREMSRELDDCRFVWRATGLQRAGGLWRVTSENSETLEAEYLVITTPPEQTRELLDGHEICEKLQMPAMRPCWALMVLLDRPLLKSHDAAFINHGPLSWVSSQCSRPGRPTDHAWVLHANPDWSEAHLEDTHSKKSEDTHKQKSQDTHEEVSRLLLDAARKLPGAQAFEVREAPAHRWRYALAPEPSNAGALWFDSLGLAVTGDWCHGSKVQGAFLGGVAAAGRIMGGRKRRKRGQSPFPR
jgi:photolyase PhrII